MSQSGPVAVAQGLEPKGCSRTGVSPNWVHSASHQVRTTRSGNRAIIRALTTIMHLNSALAVPRQHTEVGTPSSSAATPTVATAGPSSTLLAFVFLRNNYKQAGRFTVPNSTRHGRVYPFLDTRTADSLPYA